MDDNMQPPADFIIHNENNTESESEHTESDDSDNGSLAESFSSDASGIST